MKLFILVSGFTFISSTAAVAVAQNVSTPSNPQWNVEPTRPLPPPEAAPGINGYIIQGPADPATQLTPTTLMDEQRRARNRREGNPDDLPTSGTTQ